MGGSEKEKKLKRWAKYWNLLTLKRLIAATVFIAAPTYLMFRPDDYTPLVQVFFSIFLFILAFWIGHDAEVQFIQKQANDRWLPQAESVVMRLITLHSNVKRFSHRVLMGCSSAECELPELKNEEFRAVRIKLKADCEASSQRLEDIAHQLEDGIQDWTRFIMANCQDDECSRIWEAIHQRRSTLEEEIGKQED